MRFLSVGPEICLQLPSDSTSRWTPLLFGYTFPTTRACSGLAPIRARPWRANQKSAPVQRTGAPKQQYEIFPGGWQRKCSNFVETKNAAIHTSWTTTYRWLNVKQFICRSVLHRRIGISSHQGGTWIGCLIPPWEKIISVMFPLSVRRYSLFTLYIRNFLHIPLLEYMLQKASPQGETTPCGLML